MNQFAGNFQEGSNSVLVDEDQYYEEDDDMEDECPLDNDEVIR